MDSAITYPSVSYYTTLVNVAGMILSIVAAFIAGYIVYLRQQRDKYCERINRVLQKLNMAIFRWSILEKYRYPGWLPPMSRYIEILSKETWNGSPSKVLEPYVKEVEDKYNEVLKKEQEIRRSSQGTLVAGPALYLEVKFALDTLLNIIYREFPSPPGEYTTVAGIPVNVKSFVKADFPRNRREFLEWALRFEKFFETVYDLYMRRLRHIIDHLKEVHEEFAMYIVKSVKDLEKYELSYTMERMLREVVRLTYNEPRFYDKFFEHLVEMMHIVDGIRELITKYDSYVYKRRIKTVSSLIAMALTGIVIPLAALYSCPTSVQTLFRLHRWCGVRNILSNNCVDCI